MMIPDFATVKCSDCPIRHRAVCARCDTEELLRLEKMKSYRTFPAGTEILWRSGWVPPAGLPKSPAYHHLHNQNAALVQWCLILRKKSKDHRRTQKRPACFRLVSATGHY